MIFNMITKGSGGSELTFKSISLRATSKTTFIVTGIEAEPKLFMLYLSQDQTTASSMPSCLLGIDSIGENCLNIKQNGYNGYNNKKQRMDEL